MSAIDLKSSNGARERKYPLSDSGKSAIGKHAIAAAANHDAASTAKDRKTKGNNSHVPEEEKYKCEVCHSSLVNKRELIKQHEESKKHKDAVAAAAALKAKSWHCEACNLFFPNTVESVQKHMSSHEHARMTRYDDEQHRDGASIAKRQRVANQEAAEKDAAAESGKRAKQKK